MKSGKHLGALAAAALLAACSGSSVGGGGGGGAGGGGGGGTRGWTVLVYMVADNNLEPFALDNLVQMAQVGTGSNLAIAVELDRSFHYAPYGLSGIPDTTTVKRIEVTRGGVKLLQDLGDVNTGAAQSLADFISWGVKAYPAQNYALVLWDHGGAWPGFGLDESHGGDLLTLAELRQGISQGLQSAGLAKLSLLGFDACLMATFEVAESLKDLASYLLASEEVEPGAGWDYTRLSAAAQDPAPSPQALGMQLAQGFQAQNRNEAAITLSLTDLSALGDVEAALRTLNTAQTPQLSVIATQVGRGRVSALEFGKQPDPSRSVNQVDLGDLFSRLAQADPSRFSTLKAQVDAGLAKAVVGKVAGSATGAASGLSIYFPPSKSTYKQADYAAVPNVADWRAFLEAYLGVGTPLAIARPTFTSSTATATPVAGGITVSATLTPGAAEVISSATFLYGYYDPAADELALYGEDPATVSASQVAVSWDQKLAQLTQGATQGFAYLAVQLLGGGQASASIPLAYLEGGGTSCSGAGVGFAFRKIVFEAATGATLQDAYYLQASSGPVGELHPLAGSTFKPIYQLVTGLKATPASQWVCGPSTFQADQAVQLGFAAPSLPAGLQLFLGLSIENAAGQSDLAVALR